MRSRRGSPSSPRHASAATRSRRRARPERSARTWTTRSPTRRSLIERVTNGMGAMPSFKDQLTEAADPTPSRSSSPRAPASNSGAGLRLRSASRSGRAGAQPLGTCGSKTAATGASARAARTAGPGAARSEDASSISAASTDQPGTVPWWKRRSAPGPAPPDSGPEPRGSTGSRRGSERARVRRSSHERRRGQTRGHRPRDRRTSSRSASRSTTTCVIGTSKRSRAPVTTPRSSQCERPSGCVEMITSSGAERPQRVLDRLERVAVADLAPRVDARLRAAARGSARAAPGPRPRAPSSSETQCLSGELSAGQTTSTCSR